MELTYKEKTLILTQAPYLDHVIADWSSGDCYRAAAEDAEGNEYEAFWFDLCLDCDDESDAANWENYIVREI